MKVFWMMMFFGGIVASTVMYTTGADKPSVLDSVVLLAVAAVAGAALFYRERQLRRLQTNYRLLWQEHRELIVRAQGELADVQTRLRQMGGDL